jgi:hypothetical protein
MGTLIFSLFIVGIIVSANVGRFPRPLEYLYDFPGGDKAGHFILFGILSFLLNKTNPRPRRPDREPAPGHSNRFRGVESVPVPLTDDVPY